MHKKRNSIDDLLHDVFTDLIDHGSPISPSRGPAREIVGVLLELEDPRARLSRSEDRGKLFSCFGEFLWYLSRTNDLDVVSFYIPTYRDYSDGYGAYGPRLFDWDGINQIIHVQEKLRNDGDTRQGVIQLFDKGDLHVETSDVPCTCSLQFLLRDNALSLVVHMRSNDAYKGLPHDIFSFSMLQEILAKNLGVELGTYKHMVGSLHLYDDDLFRATSFLSEGFQNTISMPAMPDGDPWPDIQEVMRQEALIRLNSDMSTSLEQLPDFWADIIRLLRIYVCAKNKDWKTIENIKNTLSTDCYDTFVNDRILRA